MEEKAETVAERDRRVVDDLAQGTANNVDLEGPDVPSSVTLASRTNGNDQPSKEYKYDAFISYRHVEPDFEIAKRLHSLIESYTVPKGVPAKKRSDFRAFRDREELASGELGKAINEALADSEYLIVVCSPRTPDSPWCRREIREFRRTHPDTSIIALLVEGEPEESFPPELKDLSTRVVTAQGDTTDVALELLAADIRAKETTQADFPGYAAIEGTPQAAKLTRESLDLLKKSEILRIMATLIGVSLGDLTQRQKERRLRRIIMTASAALIALVVFGVSMTSMFITAQRAQRQATYKSAQMLMNSADESLANGDRAGAVLRAEEGFGAIDPKMDGYLDARAKYHGLLSQALMYPDFSGVARIHTSAMVPQFRVSPNDSLVLTGGPANTASVWEIPSGKLTRSIELPGEVSAVEWVSESEAVFATTTEELVFVDITTGKQNGTMDFSEFGLRDIATFGMEGKLVVGSEDTEFAIVDLAERKVIQEFDAPHGLLSIHVDGKTGRVAIPDAAAVNLFDFSGKKLASYTMPIEETTEGSEKLFPIISPDGNTMVVAFNDGVAWIDLTTGKQEVIEDDLIMLRPPVLQTSTDGKIFAFGNGTSARVYIRPSERVGGKKESLFEYVMLSHGSLASSVELTSLRMSPDNNWLVGGYQDGTIQVWDIGLGQKMEPIVEPWANAIDLPKHSGEVYGSAFTKDGAFLIPSAFDGTLQVTQAKGTAPVEASPGRFGAVSENGRFLVTIDGDFGIIADISAPGQGTITKVEHPVERPEDPNEFPETFVPVGAMSNDGDYLSVASVNMHKFGVLKVGDEYPLWVKDYPENMVKYLIETQSRPMFDHQNNLYLPGWDGTIQVYDLAGELIRTLEVGKSRVMTMSIRDDGKLLGVALSDGTSVVYDLEADQLLATVPGQIIGQTPTDTGYTAVVILHGQLHFYDETGKRREIDLNEPPARTEINRIPSALSHDGAYVLMELATGDIGLIDVKTGLLLGSYPVAGYPIQYPMFGADNTAFYYSFRKADYVGENSTSVREVKVPRIEELEKLIPDMVGTRTLPEVERIG